MGGWRISRDTGTDPKLSGAMRPRVVLRRLRLPPRGHRDSAIIQTARQDRPQSLDPPAPDRQRPSENARGKRPVHGGERRCRGPERGRGFSRAPGPPRHPSHYPKEKRWKCGDCGKAFLYPSHVEIHRRSHTGERPFICPVCGKGYRCSSSLLKHQLVHSRKTPFVCSLCVGRGSLSLTS
ncbi:putative zinc finger protein 56 [Pristis pectinata]|uniref:putative zinc finger protein 56 n=1 Tax=Pristis pectinata TaxID=685728 RepID=UPI00223D4112|nr:putative zinc finger protein 56 [Pristis pectinata]